MGVLGRRRLTLAASGCCCAVAAGCGGASPGTTSTRPAHAAPVAQRVCGAARRAAVATLPGPVAMRVKDADPLSVECRLHGAGEHLDVVAQPSSQAWMEYDTTASHQSQVYGSGVHEPRQIPRRVSAPGVLAEWIPAQSELFATNGTPSRGGCYVTVTVTGGRTRGSQRRSVALAVTLATLATAPRGPNPAPPN